MVKKEATGMEIEGPTRKKNEDLKEWRMKDRQE